MIKKRTGGKSKAFTPVAMFILFLLILLGVWIYFQQKAPYRSSEQKEVSEEKRVRELMKENPDAEIFKDGASEQESKKKSPENPSQP